MPSRNIIFKLRTLFTDLFQERASIVSVLQDAGLDTALIYLEVSPINAWSIAFQEAEKQNKFESLIQVALTRYAEHDELHHLAASYRQQQALSKIIREETIPLELAKELCGKCISLETEMKFDTPDIGGVLDFLWDLNPQTNRIHLPIFEFVKRIRDFTDRAKLKLEIDTWQKQTIAQLALKQEEYSIAALPQSAISNQNIAYFSVEIGNDPTRPQLQRYSLIIQLWDGDLPLPSLFCEYGKKLSLNEIQAKVNEIFTAPNTVRLLPRNSQQICIEFVVPHELLSVEFDRWLLPSKPYGETYGMIYPVVIRSWERAQWSFRDVDIRNLWATRAEKAKKHSCKFEEIQYSEWMCNPHAYTPKALYRKWRDNPHLVCLKMTYRPSNDPTKGDCVRLWVDAGLPVAVWVRNSEKVVMSVEEIQSRIVELVGGATVVNDLPNRFRQIRYAADNDDSQLAAHLTLFWDDAARRTEMFEADLVMP